MSRLNRAYEDSTAEFEEAATDTDSDDEEFYKKFGRSNAYVAIESSKKVSNSDTAMILQVMMI